MSDQERLAVEAYDAAASRRDGKFVASAALGVGGGLAFAPTLWGMVGGGALVGGADNLTGQLIDRDGQLSDVDYALVGWHSLVGASFGGATFGALSGLPATSAWLGSKLQALAPAGDALTASGQARGVMT